MLIEKNEDYEILDRTRAAKHLASKIFIETGVSHHQGTDLKVLMDWLDSLVKRNKPVSGSDVSLLERSENFLQRVYQEQYFLKNEMAIAQ